MRTLNRVDEIAILTHFSSIFYFYTSGGVEMDHWAKIG